MSVHTQPQCVKTGCHLYCRETQRSYLGDLYTVGDPKTAGMVYLLRYSHKEYKPIRPILNAISVEATDWEFAGMGVLVVTDMEWYDYDGEKLTEGHMDVLDT